MHFACLRSDLRPAIKLEPNYVKSTAQFSNSSQRKGAAFENAVMQVIKAWICLCIFFSANLADIWAAEPEIRFNLLTLPSTRQADQRLAMPASLNYEHAPLRQCMIQLSEHYQFSYWIDRRVDADKPIPRTTVDGTLRECLIKLASDCNAEVGLVENVVTIAKAEHLAAMQYASVRLHNQLSLGQLLDGQGNDSQTTSDAPSKGPNAEMKPLAWPMLTTPTELAESINENWKLDLEFKLPHDLMNAGKLQPCTVATQLTLLYGGFDQCAAGKGLRELRLLKMPPAGSWKSSYPASTISAEQISAIKQAHADARIEKSGNSWTVIGATALHLQLLQAAKRSTTNSSRPGRTPPTGANDPLAKQRFDISKQADKPLGAILKNLGDQLGLTIQWDSSLPPSAQHTLVTIEANKSKLDDILLSLGAQAKLEISRSGTTVTITAPGLRR